MPGGASSSHAHVRTADPRRLCELVGTTAAGPTSVERVPDALTVMTYNIKNPNPVHHWERRLPLLLDVVHRNTPDVLCVQEAYVGQMDDLRAALPGWRDIGQGREGGTAGEHAAVFFRDDRLELLEDGAFWLSDTPDVVASNTWGSVFMRMATWGRFRDRRTDAVFTLLTTHLDHEENDHGDEVRRRSAELIARRMADVEGPVVVTGDFNEGAGLGPASEPFADAGWVDVWVAAGVTDTVSSFNTWVPPVHEGVRIDWVLTRGDIEVEAVHMDHDGPITWAASDHFPIVASLRIHGSAEEGAARDGGARDGAAAAGRHTVASAPSAHAPE